MGKDPAILFYTSDFLASTQGLSLTEMGMLIKLLCMQHQNGHLSKKFIKTAVGKITTDVLAYFKEDECGCLYNERMENEVERRKRFAESRRENANARWGKEKCICNAGAMHTETVTETKTETETKTKTEYGKFNNVYLKAGEYERLKELYPHTYKEQIDNLSYYIESKGDVYKSHYATILSWIRKEEAEKGYSSFDTEEFFQAALERSQTKMKDRIKRQ